MTLPTIRFARLAVLVAIALVAAAALNVDRRPKPDRYEHFYARAVQRQRLRWLAYRITSYARVHKRPAFHLDSVLAHMDSAKAAEFSYFMVDVWGKPIHYWWDETSFTLVASGGQRFGLDWSSALIPRVDATNEERFRVFMAIGRREDVREEYGWPTEARGTRNALGQFAPLAR